MSLEILVRLFGWEATNNRVEDFACHFAPHRRWALAHLPAADNPYLWQMWTGRFPPDVVSPWLAAPILLSLPRITSATGFMADALAAATDSVDVVHLSNILDWLSPEQARHTLALAGQVLRPGGRVIIRQLNSTLDIPTLASGFVWETARTAALHARDRSFFYRAVHLGRKP